MGKRNFKLRTPNFKEDLCGDSRLKAQRRDLLGKPRKRNVISRRLTLGWYGGKLSLLTAVNYKIGNEKLVKVLDNASSHLRGLLEKQGRSDGALRIAVIGGGCSGLQYKMDLVDGPRDRDIMVPSNGVNVVIDPKSALFVSGSELDFSDDLQQGGFKVSNPNAVVTCSCGESFAA
jgi:iron-sulfur cluster assembly protein